METCNKTKQLNRSPAAAFSVLCLVFVFLSMLVLSGTQKAPPPAEKAADVSIMGSFDVFVQDALSQAEDAATSVPKVFWLPEDATKGLVPDPEKYGSTDDPSTLDWLLKDAESLLDGQRTLFSTDLTLMPGSKVTYYLDESIFAITWKQVMDGAVYTISEIKVSHPSQFRRHLQGGTFENRSVSTPTYMSRSVNAVVGSSADHHRCRKEGIIVYDGVVKRFQSPRFLDTCYIDDQGNLIFTYAGDLLDIESAQKFVDENNIGFSICFGPIIIDNGVRRNIPYYMLGEGNERYARAALGQMDDLHYLVITANREGRYRQHLTIHEFADHVEQFGCEKVYTMDGGNTGSLVMNGKLINRTTFGYEREQGDLLYFCTAAPNSNTTG